MISVIVPVYNIELYLERCLLSLIGQTYKNIEIICTDDGSADGSGIILDELAYNNPNIISIHKNNAGVTTARITGIEIANGENIGFCDGDDLVEPVMYERLLENKTKYNADISHCGHKVVYVDGREKYFYNTGRLVKQDNTEGLKELLSGSFEPGLWSKLYSKTLLHKLINSGKLDTDIKLNEDLLVNYYLFSNAKKSVYEDICPYMYLKRDGSASVSKSERFIKDPIRVREIILNDVDQQNQDIFISAMISYIRINISMYMHCLKHKYDTRKVLISKFRNNIYQNKKYIKFLNIGGIVHAYMIIYTPYLCKIIFKNY